VAGQTSIIPGSMSVFDRGCVKTRLHSRGRVEV
jgi:hypothetical protein